MKRTFILFLSILLVGAILRLYQLGAVPISLHSDEAGVGYNAFALITAGIDEYGKPWPLIFRADVSPAIFYTTLPSIALFGLTEFATRLPSALLGLICTGLFFLLIRELVSTKTALLATLLFSLSPWHIQVSRITHDALYSLILQLCATFFFLKSKHTKKTPLLLCFILFGVSFYTYHSPRLTSPLLLIGLLYIYWEKVRLLKMTIFYGFILFFLIITPITIDFITKPIANTRLGGISIFTREDTSVPFNFVYFVKLVPTFTANYVNQFNPYFLFANTASVRYFNVEWVGLVYWWELLTVSFGLIILRRDKSLLKYFVLWWIVISVLPGSLTRGNPNAGRIFMLLPILSLLSAIGIQSIFKRFDQKIHVAVTFLLSVSIMFFVNQYFIDAPKRFAQQWNYGAKETAEKILEHENDFEKIIISDQFRQAYIYILFYGKKDPRWLSNLTDKRRNPFIGYDAFGKYEFRSIDWSTDEKIRNVMFVGTPQEIPENQASQIVKNRNGDALYFLVFKK